MSNVVVNGYTIQPGSGLFAADLSGADLQLATLSGADLQQATLRGADLYKTDLSGADLHKADVSGADLRETDLRETRLSGADLRNANLTGAVLFDANLSEAKIKGAKFDFDKVPVIPEIHRTLASVFEDPNKTLDMSGWHYNCNTTHCRAGWITTLAGHAGAVLELMIGPNAAAALIYAKSDPELEQIPDWFASDEDAMADIKRMAGL